MNPISIRLLRQQLCAPQFTKPEDVVRHFGAMQGQEYRLMRWAVAMRTKKPSAKAFQKAYDSGKIIRLHLLRGTWQLVAAEDYHWMLDLFADKARRVIQGWMSANNISIPDDEYAQIGAILLKCASDIADEMQIKTSIGYVLSSDYFYYPDPDAKINEKAKDLGIMAVEMETSGLYLTAMAAHKKALALFQISDHIFTGEALSAEERQNSFTDMIYVALETALSVAD